MTTDTPSPQPAWAGLDAAAGDDPQTLAARCAEAMWRGDKASSALGMVIEATGPGTATVSMTIGDMMVNGHGICHGGYIFMLADSAFAFSCNSYNQRTVAQQCAISFLKSARLGDHLTAEAAERWREGRSGIYDITVRDQTGSVVAEFRGSSRTIAGTLLDGPNETRAAG